MSPVTVLLPSLFPGSRLKIQVEEAAFSSGWVQPSWAKTELLEWGKKSASCWQAAQAQQLLGTQAVILGESCPRQQHMYQKGGLGCAKAHTAQTSPLSQLLYLRIFLPSLQVIAAKRTNSSWHVKARKEEKAPGPDGFTLPPAWTPLLCHRKVDWPPDRGYHVSLQPQALPLTAGCAWEAWAAAHGDNTQ